MSNTITAKVNFNIPQLGRIGLSALGHFAIAAFWAADRFVAYSRQRKVIAALMAMDDRQLKDLGMSRNDIIEHVGGTFGSRRSGES
jgi:uncharacterized protein YjiS (DUF1127 family)